MKKIFLLLAAVPVFATMSCSKEDADVDPEVLIGEIFNAGMQWNTQAKTATSETLKSTYPINITVDNTVNGPEGGTIHVIGSVTGSMSIDDNTYAVTGGIMQLGLTETINDYAFVSDDEIYTMNGDPYISLTGTFTLAPGGNTFGTQSSMQISGGVNVSGPGVDKTINMKITINIDADGRGGDVSGTVDGVRINYTF